MKLSKDAFEFRKCTLDDLDEICLIQEEAFDAMVDDSLLRRNSRESLEKCLNEPHYTLGAFHGNTLAGFAILFNPMLTDENIALSAGFSEESAKNTVNFKLVIVRPDYRGNGLQTEFIERLEVLAKEKGFKKIFATVSPNNEYSKNNFLKNGYVFHSQKEKYGGLLRNIYYKDI